MQIGLGQRRERLLAVAGEKGPLAFVKAQQRHEVGAAIRHQMPPEPPSAASSRVVLSSTRTMCWHIEISLAERLAGRRRLPDERTGVVADPPAARNDAQPHVEVLRAPQRLVEEAGGDEDVAPREHRHHHVALLGQERLEGHRRPDEG